MNGLCFTVGNCVAVIHRACQDVFRPLPFEMRSPLDASHLTDTGAIRGGFMRRGSRRRASNRGFSRSASYVHPRNAPAYIQRGGIRL